MKERPILMQGWGVRATLDDRKGQTRRVMKPQPNYSILKAGTELEPHRCPPLGPNHYGRSEWGLYGTPYHYSDVPCFGYDCPYGQPGDLLYFKETWAPQLGSMLIQYRASGDQLHPLNHWRPSIHMSKKYARIWRRITDIRAERVQSITWQDCKAEGIPWATLPGQCNAFIDEFARLWDSINKKPKLARRNPWTLSPGDCYVSYPWENIQETRVHRGLAWYVIGNPYVWALSHEKVDR